MHVMPACTVWKSQEHRSKFRQKASIIDRIGALSVGLDKFVDLHGIAWSSSATTLNAHVSADVVWSITPGSHRIQAKDLAQASQSSDLAQTFNMHNINYSTFPSLPFRTAWT
ncbi:unnamed protein product [Polarella glacialis]|uniref:Uncharacterized protein n=1 Tax=Polarella glacialis TaxID=89957 RepID=A0A813L3Y8_POLGL|nr:unnamed protein product [Polarella glacialis]